MIKDCRSRLKGKPLHSLPAHKFDVAPALGHAGDTPDTVKKPKTAWEKNKPKIMALVGDFFGEGHNNRWLRRKTGS